MFFFPTVEHRPVQEDAGPRPEGNEGRRPQAVRGGRDRACRRLHPYPQGEMYPFVFLCTVLLRCFFFCFFLCHQCLLACACRIQVLFLRKFGKLRIPENVGQLNIHRIFLGHEAQMAIIIEQRKGMRVQPPFYMLLPMHLHDNEHCFNVFSLPSPPPPLPASCTGPYCAIMSHASPSSGPGAPQELLRGQGAFPRHQPRRGRGLRCGRAGRYPLGRGL